MGLAQNTAEQSRYPVRAAVEIRRSSEARLTLTDGKRSVSVLGDTPSEAINHPLTADEVRGRICKTGGTPLSLSADDVEVRLDDGLNLPPSSLNSLRRSAVEAFCNFERDIGNFEYKYVAERVRTPDLVTAEFYRAEEFVKAYRVSPSLFGGFNRMFVPLDSDGEAISRAGGVAVPSVVTDS